jgi:hypothetical protein
MVSLTPEQVQALRSSGGQPVAALDPASQETFYIVSEHDRGLIEELIEEERLIKAFADASWHDTLQRMRDEP